MARRIVRQPRTPPGDPDLMAEDMEVTDLDAAEEADGADMPAEEEEAAPEAPPAPAKARGKAAPRKKKEETPVPTELPDEEVDDGFAPARTVVSNERESVDLRDKRHRTKKHDQQTLEQWSVSRRRRSQDQYFQGVAEAARREAGHRGIYGADRAKMLITIPCPSLAFEWVAAVNGFPLGLIIQMVGFPKVGKSGLLAEFFRWFDMVGGGGELKECETKFSDIWYSSIMTQEAYERMGLERCESINDWQSALTKTVDRHQRVMLGTKEKPGIGRIIPICLGVDTIMGKMSQGVQEAIHGKKLPDGTYGKTGTGFADRGHPVEALMIAKYLRTFPQRLDGWPFTAVFVNHVSVKVNPDTHQEERNKPGGKLVGYQESLELQLSRPSTKDIRTPHFEGHLVDISNHASSIGPGGRMCRTRLLWTYYRDAQGRRRQRTVWDWDWSTVWLLHRIMEDAKFSPQVRRHLREAGFHLKVVESGTTDNAAYSTTLGMRADQAVSWRELGRRIRSDAAVMKMLRDCLVIQECPHLRGPYLEQLNALAAERA